MKRSSRDGILAFLTLCGLFFTVGPYSGGSGGNAGSGNPTDDLLGFTDNPYHNFTDAEYLERRRIEPKGGICFALKGDSTTMTAVALFDSIATGLVSPQVQLKLTIFVDPDSTRSTRLNAHMTIAEVQDAATRSWVEIASINSKGLGKNQAGNDRADIENTLEAFQDSAASWNIPSFRTHRWGSEAYQLGIGDIAREHGYFQAIRRTQHPQAIYTDVDNYDGLATDNANYWQLAAATFAHGDSVFTGHHTIGEHVSDFNLGGHVWNVSAAHATADSVTKFLDMGLHSFAMSLFITSGKIRDSSSTADMSYTTFRSLAVHYANRVSEDLAEPLTVENLAARKRAIRTGNLFPHHGFTVLGSNASYTNGAIVSKLSGSGANGLGPCESPLGFPHAIQQIASSVDTMQTLGAALSVNQIAVENLAVDGDSVLAAATAAGISVRYGRSSATSNVIMQRTNSNARGRPLTVRFITTGCDARAIEVTGQVMITSAATVMASDTLFVGHKLLQASEDWGNYGDEGPSAYQYLARVLTTYNLAEPDTAAFADSLHSKERVTMLGVSRILFATDSTYAGTGLSHLPYDDSAESGLRRWHRDLWFHNLDRLRPSYLVDNMAVEWDTKSSTSGYRSISSPDVVDHEPLYHHFSLITAIGVVYDFRIVVDIDQMTDYVAGFLYVGNRAGTVSTASFGITWLDISCRTLN